MFSHDWSYEEACFADVPSKCTANWAVWAVKYRHRAVLTIVSHCCPCAAWWAGEGFARVDVQKVLFSCCERSWFLLICLVWMDGTSCSHHCPCCCFQTTVGMKWKNPVSQCYLVLSWAEGCRGMRRKAEGRIHALVQVPWFETQANTPQAIKGRHFFS